jgi:bacterioferritin-associated ferredoxin
MDDLAVIAGTRLARNSPEGLAIMRATIAAHPYQQARRAHGCEHPCAQCASEAEQVEFWRAALPTTEGEGS